MRERDLNALEFGKVLASIAELAASEPGRRATALTPSTDPAQVRTRLRATAEMAELRSRSGSLPINDFADVRGLFLAAARDGAVLGGSALSAVRDFVVAARHAAAFLRSRIAAYPHVSSLAQNLIAPKELADALLGALADDGTLLDDASRDLMRLRNRLRDARSEIEARLARALAASGMEAFVSDRVVTLRNRRFVLPLKLNYAEKLEGIVQDRSVSGETLFVEPLWAVELNNRLMMLEREVEAEENRILAFLSAMVRGCVRELQITFDAMVALDALNARAIFAERFGCAEPEIADGGINLIGARHPLLALSGANVVPIDITIGSGKRGLVISGPNAGGKTVALKTIGLFALMAQAGILIPVQAGSFITVFRGVYADIGDQQSIEASLSTFAAHIMNLSEIVTRLEEPALVILDEPGAGTDPAEGAALAIGLMNYLDRRDCILAIATHSTAVKLHGYSRAGYEAAAVDFDPERLLPFYRLKPHSIGQSYGLAVARRLGLPAEITDGAERARSEGSRSVDEVLERLEAERAELKKRIAEAEERFVALAERELAIADAAAQGRQSLERERARFRADAKDLIDELRREGATTLQALKERMKSHRDLDRLLTDSAGRIDDLAPAQALTAKSEPALRVGDQVELGELRGELIALDGGRAVISRGGMRIEVALERLRRAPAGASHASAPRIAVHVADDNERDEFNVIGMRASDALRAVEAFLDQSYLTGRSEVRIVHGLGSGALRKAIHEYLETSRYCTSFREADPHQGGAGATIVQMNL